MRSILDYGASAGAGAGENRKAIQSAIDAASAAGGDTVYVPSGRFATGNLRLKSNVTLHLETGAVLEGSRDWRDYEFSGEPFVWASMTGIADVGQGARMSGFIWAEGAENIAIEGKGIVDGQGANHAFPCADDPFHRRPMLMLFVRCKGIRVTDVTMREPAMFNFYAIASRRIWVRGVFIDSWRTENGDGLDFDGSEEVIISDCNIEAGDDAIGLKCNLTNTPCREYTISNCRLSSVWAGVRVGPESHSDMKDIVVTGCVFEKCNDAVKLQDCSDGVLENIRVSDCIFRDVHRPFFITSNPYRLSRQDASIRPKRGGVRNIVLEGITAYQSCGGADYQRNESVISGTMEDRVENVTLRNIQCVFDGGGTAEMAARTDVPEYIDYSFLYADVFSINGYLPAAGLYLRHVRGLRLENCDFSLRNPDGRPMLFAEDAELLLRDVRLSGERGGDLVQTDSTVRLRDCEGFRLSLLEGEALNRLLKAREISQKTDATFAKWASEYDAAEACPRHTLIRPEAWKKTESGAVLTAMGTDAKYLMLHFFGNMTLYVNGREAGETVLPKLYENLLYRAFSLAGLLTEGENRIEVRWHDPAQYGGIDCLLPFGEFRPHRVEILAPTMLAG